MLKFVFALSLVLSVTSKIVKIPTQEKPKVDDLEVVISIIHGNGYPADVHTVQTEDGYILDLIRIPHGIPISDVDYDSQVSIESSQENTKKHDSGLQKRAVLLLPGIASSADDFVLGGEEEGLAFVLADRGYDVFLGNFRGSKYGRKHSTLNPDKDSAFWRFCWEDMALKDLPAIIDNVLEITDRQRLSIIGHMQGSTVSLVMASKKVEYNDKISLMVVLGPLAFLGNTRNDMFLLAAEKEDSDGWIAKNFGQNEFRPSEEAIMEGGGKECRSNGYNSEMCVMPFMLLNGYNSNHLNTTTIMPLLNKHPQTGTSTRGILHYGKLVKNKRFSNLHGEDYPLERVDTKVVVFYTKSDMTSTNMDVDKLVGSLPNVAEVFAVKEFTNNLDLLFGNNVARIVYTKVARVLRGDFT